MKRIVFAGGCFWGVEAYFKRLKGVIDTTVGYTNGNIANPRYEDLLAGRATHAEAVEIFYDEKVITLEKLLENLFRIIDPTSINRQGGDIGVQYRTGVYYQFPEDKIVIKNFILENNKKYDGKIAVEVAEETGFFPAETYHQDYLDKNPGGYCHVDLSLLRADEQKD
ncbi:MAG TPA: peptide-methionine (S)-S-oxide reductase MsrA [Acholeplasmataceae bacterium]|jgi:peptide-methionine (S)-S-oxide reductase|nr:peptide-methionine (S)-S-oxide reductase MsrA [Acholeplasmataceae bacterium]